MYDICSYHADIDMVATLLYIIVVKREHREKGNEMIYPDMMYAVTTIIEGQEIDVICNGVDEYIDVCEELGNNVLRVVEWEKGSAIRREVAIDWL